MCWVMAVLALLALLGCGDGDSKSPAGSSDASLRSLVPSTGELSPEFARTSHEYLLRVPNRTGELTLAATASDENVRSLELTQDDEPPITLKNGEASLPLAIPQEGASSRIAITVTAEDATTTARYEIELVQTAPVEGDATLSSLTSSAGSLRPEFSPDAHQYELGIPHGTETFALTAITSDPAATILLDGEPWNSGAPSEPLAVPDEESEVEVVILVVTSDGESSQEYVVRVSRQATPSLSACAPSKGALIPVFDPGTYRYTWRVPVGTSSVSVTPTAERQSDTITVAGQSVPSGQACPIALPADDSSSSVPMAVTSGDTTTTYTLNVSWQPVADIPTLYSIGDSTMANYDPALYPNQRGWGQEFPRFLSGGIELVNRAINGKSSKTYYSSGVWDQVKGSLEVGDYVFVQFGHNDEKDDGIEGSSGTGTDAWGTYRDHLVRYVEETRALGAHPVLFTPVVRLGWDGAVLTPAAQHDLTGNGTAVGDANYPDAIRDVAAELDCPLVDMTRATGELVEEYGPVDAKAILYVSTDNTHLQVMGAARFAQVAAEGLLSLGLFSEQLRPELGLAVSPEETDFGNRFVGTSLTRPFAVMGLSLPVAPSSLTVTAPPGFLLGTDAEGSFSASLEIPYTRGDLPPTVFFVRFQPESAEAFTEDLTFDLGSETAATAVLAGAGRPLPTASAEVWVEYPLDAGTSCSTFGPVVCVEETLVGLYAKDYEPATTLVPVPTELVSQRISILGATPDSWSPEADIDPERYIEFAISPDAGTSVSLDTISLYAGSLRGNMIAYRISYSLEDDFGNATELWNLPDNAANALVFHAASPSVEVGPEQTLWLRVYPYSTVMAKDKYLALRSVTLHGVAY